MDTGTNKVSVVLRITGLASDVAMLVKDLGAIDERTVTRPPTVPADALPEAWWAIEVIRHDQESTETVIVEALDKLGAVQNAFQTIANDPRFRIELDCTVEIEKERPVIEVSPGTLKRLACFHVALGFEVHDYRE